jgi:serine/threonine protein kinase
MSTENEWAASMIGRTLDGQYRLDGILGEGAMGVVFRGTNLAVDKAVAIKMMRKETFAEPDAVERFKREAKVWSQLNHPSIAQVFDFGLQGDMPYLVMELVDGDDLSDVLDREGPLAPLRAITVMRQLAAALEEAHRLGVVHRDIKPQNITTVEKRCETSRPRVRRGGKSQKLSRLPKQND